MKPMIVITDVVSKAGDVVMREKTIALFGHVVYRKSESYPIDGEDRTVGFNTNGTNLTYVEDE